MRRTRNRAEKEKEYIDKKIARWKEDCRVGWTSARSVYARSIFRSHTYSFEDKKREIIVLIMLQYHRTKPSKALLVCIRLFLFRLRPIRSAEPPVNLVGSSPTVLTALTEPCTRAYVCTLAERRYDIIRNLIFASAILFPPLSLDLQQYYASIPHIVLCVKVLLYQSYVSHSRLDIHTYIGTSLKTTYIFRPSTKSIKLCIKMQIY